MLKRKMQTMDGNNACAHVAYAFTEVAAIYPITPSSVISEVVDKWSASGRLNIFGDKARVVEMQSEAGAAGTVHGSLAAGALTTTFTASQGLLLMIPNMYKMAGELLPAVIHVSARAIATHALSIFGDHSDVYACRQTGFAMLAATNPQEVMDLGAVAHIAAFDGRVPFLHFFDGFRTSHEIQKVAVWENEDLLDLLNMDAVDEFRRNCLNPERPVLRGSAQNPDIFFQAKEAANVYYDRLPQVVEQCMERVNKKIGTDYGLFNYYGAPDADRIIVAMGSICDCIEEVIDYMLERGEKVGLVKVRLYRPFSASHAPDADRIIVAMGSICDCIEEVIDYMLERGEKVGLVKVRLYRPFSASHMLAVIPKTVKSITVLDRTKEPGALGEPLYLDVCAAVRGTEFANLPIYTGRYGLGSKDVNPAQIFAVYDNANNGKKQKFTIGIVDDVTGLSLPDLDTADTTPEGTTSCKFWGLGSDGTVGANKNSIKIIGDHTDMNVQGYFAYDSKKSGGVTISHLRFGSKPIKSTYYVTKADFVACHNQAYLTKYDMVGDIKPGGVFLLNTSWRGEDLEKNLPGFVKRVLAKNNIKFYVIDGVGLGKEIGLNNRINTILQSAFFKLTKIIPEQDAIKYMKDAATYTYSKRGDAVVKMNHDAIDIGAERIEEIPVPAHWADAEGDLKIPTAKGKNKELVDFVNEVLMPVNAQLGDKLPVSAFTKGREDGHMPQGTAAFEKRGIAVDVPEWDMDACIQCNICALVCPHAVIRPGAMTETEASSAPESMRSKDMTGLAGLKYAITISTLDCTGCGDCVQVCPAKGKALHMKPLHTQLKEQDSFNYAITIDPKEEVLEKFKDTTVKGSQFHTPLLEFSGACAGCGETPYAKLLTQLFGDRMYIANATGCSSIWGASAPASPYTTNSKGEGPAWGNSLFEDNAEFGYGMYLASNSVRYSLRRRLEGLASTEPSVSSAVAEYIETFDDGVANRLATNRLIKVLEGVKNPMAAEILKDKEFLSRKSNWILGGDGWAYDIGFGGLDHVIASGEDVNILVFDTEVYSNTGGQASKATSIGAVAQFAASGKPIRKKDLAAIAMSYGYVYVAQVSMGADYQQCVKAFHEAESYKGPSIIIAYAPCISHGINGGLVNTQAAMKMAVQSGYWHNFRFDPRLADEGKNPFVLDSKEPSIPFEDFLKNEVRYTSLERAFPERAKELFAEAERVAKKKYEHLLRLTKLYEV